jgi:hypothetical protein
LVIELVDEFGPDLVKFFEDVGERAQTFIQALREDPQFFIRLRDQILELAGTTSNYLFNILIPGFQSAFAIVGQFFDVLFRIGELFNFSEQQVLAFVSALAILNTLGILGLFANLIRLGFNFSKVLFNITSLITGGRLLKGILALKADTLALFTASTASATAFRALLVKGLGFAVFGALATAAFVSIIAFFKRLEGEAAPTRAALEDIGLFLTNIPDIVKGAAFAVVDFFVQIRNSVAGFFQGLTEDILRIGDQVFTFFLELPVKVFQSVKEAAANVTRAILETIDSFFGNLINISDQTIENISNAVGNFIGGLAALITTPLSVIGAGITGLLTGLGAFLTEFTRADVEAIIEVVTAPFRLIEALVQKAQDLLSKFFNRTKQEAQNTQQEVAEIAAAPLPNKFERGPVVDFQGRSTFGPGFAQGGLVSGPGTSTSDSILARLSNGEAVINAAAVRKVGSNFIHALNRGIIPGFASGGIAGGLQSSMATPSFPSIGVVPVEANTGPSGRPIVLDLGNGMRVEAVTNEGGARTLQRELRDKNLNKPGDRPFWY